MLQNKKKHEIFLKSMQNSLKYFLQFQNSSESSFTKFVKFLRYTPKLFINGVIKGSEKW